MCAAPRPAGLPPWPEYRGYWPKNVKRSVDINSFFEAFKTIGYEICPDGNLEEGFKKVAIYTDQHGKPTHMARQLADGTWTSKLGKYIDINHFDLKAIEGPAYGTVSAFMKKTIE